MKQKINTWLGMVIIIIIAITSALFAYFFTKDKESISSKKQTPVKKEQRANPDETADWQTYRNGKYGFEFRYPNDWRNDSSDDEHPQFLNASEKDIVNISFFGD